MSEVETNEVEISEIEGLKSRLDLLGVKYHHNAGIEKLSKLYQEATAKEEEVEATEPEAPKVKPEEDPLALVRVYISCHNPAKSTWEGDLWSVGNKNIGTIRKFVPFDREWHVPRIILDMMKEKKFQQFYTVKDKRGNPIRKGRLAKEYNIEYLDPLSEKELKELAQRQAMASGDADAL
jgi:DNA-dependent RNA polymerase auxiliary subunit epsilon